MVKSDTSLEELLIDINKSINEKIVGTNFLELLKFALIEKLNTLAKASIYSSTNFFFSNVNVGIEIVE